MKVGTFFIRVWRLLSIVGLLFALFSSYISYPAEVAVRFDSVGTAIQYVNREVLFYGAVVVFLLNNTIINLIARLIVRVPSVSLPVPYQGAWATHRAELNQVIQEWFYALMAAINTIMGLALLVLSFLNRSDRSQQPVDYAWLLPLSVGILIIVLVALPVRLFMKPASND